jgi:hypothetical protein
LGERIDKAALIIADAIEKTRPKEGWQPHAGRLVIVLMASFLLSPAQQ